MIYEKIRQQAIIKYNRLRIIYNYERNDGKIRIPNVDISLIKNMTRKLKKKVKYCNSRLTTNFFMHNPHYYDRIFRWNRMREYKRTSSTKTRNIVKDMN